MTGSKSGSETGHGGRTFRSRLPVRLSGWIPALLILAVLPAAFVLIFPAAAKSSRQAVFNELLMRYLAFRSGSGWFQTGFSVQPDIGVPMRDGIRLATDIYLPSSRGPFPAVLMRTPYSKQEMKPAGEFFARYGFAVAVQDTRGRHKSEGAFYPFRNEMADGVDFARWVRRQSWCNGKLGGFGASYLGFTQWAMAGGDAGLTSISPAFITANLYEGIYQNGAFGQLTFLHWSLTSNGRYGDMRGAARIKSGFGSFPLIGSDDAAGKDIDFYNDWVDHPEPDAYWQGMSIAGGRGSIATPAFLVAGWYDFFVDAQIRDFQSIRHGGSEAARAGCKILIGPWGHGFYSRNLENYGIKPKWGEVIPFEYIRDSKAWLDYSLKGVRNGWERRAPVRAFVLGDNQWRDEREWPPARSSYRTYYLHSGGKAATARGDGTLALSRPTAREPFDEFVFDPRNPVPTAGGGHGDIRSSGPADQREVEKRPDVLVYSTAALQQPLLVMGPVRVRLFASSTAADTDFTAKLVDVFPDERAVILCEGIVRARYRNGLSRPELMRPGTVYGFDIEVGHTAVRLKARHRIRLEISSSNSPRYDVNPNTGRPIATERDTLRATQRVFHTPDAASALILPVVEE